MKIGICGATGYSGRELIRILLHHPKVQIAFLTSEQYANQSIADVYPELRSKISVLCQPVDQLPPKGTLDFVFLALPHTVSMKVAKVFLAQGTRVIDLSGDYRLSASLYETWYQHPHEDVENLSKAVYGLSEIFRDKIKKATFVSNPGCYPTAASLGLVPALKGGFIDPQGIVIDAKSGVSGAGRGLSLGTHFVEVYENMKAYKIAVHQHTPEIEQVLKNFTSANIHVTFVPHLIPLEKGILSTMYAFLAKKVKTENLVEAYQKFYQNEPFIRVLPLGNYPQTKNVYGSNFCDIGLQVDERTNRVIVISVIDNMVKGASGQAVQNMNLMCGLAETMGLL
ncbi:MAG: N-acetyl-gamma-glutamyl-phosphate reductase [Chlamydiae bacterium]|nr:N-acetyl-gamma-glutamyl-phosphate reductase [Chlamydiota bacterium]MBI3265805.1 N-acetyl-gamma-glutamyl-phosphate reductase [Chlamydiota bacterium]